MIALAGCAPTAWVKPGASMADVRLQTYQCRHDADLAHPANSNDFADNFAAGMAAEGVFEECMGAHGFFVQR
jgi:hypothetical protein